MAIASALQGFCTASSDFIIPHYSVANKARIITKMILRCQTVSPTQVTLITIKIGGKLMFKQSVVGSATIELNDLYLPQYATAPYGNSEINVESDATGTDIVYVDATSAIINTDGTFQPVLDYGTLNNSLYQYFDTGSPNITDIIKGIYIVSTSLNPVEVKISTRKYTTLNNLYKFTLTSGQSVFISDIAHVVTNNVDDRIEISVNDSIDYCFVAHRSLV